MQITNEHRKLFEAAKKLATRHRQDQQDPPTKLTAQL